MIQYWCNAWRIYSDGFLIITYSKYWLSSPTWTQYQVVQWNVTAKLPLFLFCRSSRSIWQVLTFHFLTEIMIYYSFRLLIWNILYILILHCSKQVIPVCQLSHGSLGTWMTGVVRAHQSIFRIHDSTQCTDVWIFWHTEAAAFPYDRRYAPWFEWVKFLFYVYFKMTSFMISFSSNRSMSCVWLFWVLWVLCFVDLYPLNSFCPHYKDMVYMGKIYKYEQNFM